MDKFNRYKILKKDSILKKGLIILTLLVYRIALDMQYLYTISPLYEYRGYYTNIIPYKYNLSYICTFVVCIHTCYLLKSKSCSSLFLIILNLLYFIPGLSLYALYGGISDSYLTFYVIGYLLLFYLNKYVPYYSFKNNLRKKRETPFFLLSLFVIFTTIIIVGVYNKFQIKLDLNDIYDLRADQTDASLPVLVGYAQPIAAMFTPIALLYYLEKKKISMVAILVIVQLMSFAFGGLKSTFFSLIIAIAAIFYNGNRKLLVIAISLFSILALAETFLLHSSELTITITRRTSFIPNMIGYQYYDFFSNHELLYWRVSILRWFGFDNPYHRYIPWLIGETYYGVRMGCNTGMFGEAFSQFGWFSLIIYSFLYIWAFRLFDACVMGLDEKVKLISVFLLSMSFVDGAFWGVMLTEGFLFTCLALYYMPRKKNKPITPLKLIT